MAAEHKASELKDSGNAAFRKGNYDAAESFYSRAIQQSPQNPVLYTNRAQARLRLSRWSDAIADCYAALHLQGQQSPGRSPSRPSPPPPYPQSHSPPPSSTYSHHNQRQQQQPQQQQHQHHYQHQQAQQQQQSQTCPKNRTKALYLLAQGQVELGQVNEAYTNALEAYNIYVSYNAEHPSLRPMSELVVRTKVAWWDARERQRLRSQSVLLSELEDLLRAEAETETANVDRWLRTGEIGNVGAAETKERINESLAEKIRGLYSTFARADPSRMTPREIPNCVVDPITFAIMHDPVITPYGHSYERAAILHHLNHRHVDPMTTLPLQPAQLIPNIKLREACEEFIENARGWMFEF